MVAVWNISPDNGPFSTARIGRTEMHQDVLVPRLSIPLACRGVRMEMHLHVEERQPVVCRFLSCELNMFRLMIEEIEAGIHFALCGSYYETINYVYTYSKVEACVLTRISTDTWNVSGRIDRRDSA